MRYIAALITLLFIIVGVKLILTGNKLYDESQVFPKAEQIDYGAFAAERPLVGWYQINDAQIDMTEGAYRSVQVNGDVGAQPSQLDIELLQRSQDVYVPLHSLGRPNDSADVILSSRDPDLVNTIRSMAAGPIVSTHAVAPRIVKGMVRLPSELPDRVRRLLGSSITSQSIIIDEYAAPSARRAMQTMGAGAALLFATALLWLFIWRSEHKPIDIPDEYMPDALVLDEPEF